MYYFNKIILYKHLKKKNNKLLMSDFVSALILKSFDFISDIHI